VEGKIVRLAEQYRETHRVVGAHGLHGRVEREARIAAAAAILTGHDAADAADMDVMAVPVDGTEVDAGVAGKPALGRVDQHAQIGMRPDDMAPGKFLDALASEHRG